MDGRTDNWSPGDIVLTSGYDAVSLMVRLIERCGRRSGERRYSCWSHAALIVDGEGGLIEVLGRGVVRGSLQRYLDGRMKTTRVAIINIDADDNDRRQMIAFAEAALALRSKYGWTAAISVAISRLTRARLSFFWDGQFTCSGLVARALERTSIIFDCTPDRVTPADLAKRFAVEAMQRTPRSAGRTSA